MTMTVRSTAEIAANRRGPTASSLPKRNSRRYAGNLGCNWRRRWASRSRMVASGEVSRWRVPVSMLQALAQALSVDSDGSLGDAVKTARGAGGKRGPDPQWQQQIEAVAQQPKSLQQFIARMIMTVLAEASAR